MKADEPVLVRSALIVVPFTLASFTVRGEDLLLRSTDAERAVVNITVRIAVDFMIDWVRSKSPENVNCGKPKSLLG